MMKHGSKEQHNSSIFHTLTINYMSGSVIYLRMESSFHKITK